MKKIALLIFIGGLYGRSNGMLVNNASPFMGQLTSFFVQPIVTHTDDRAYPLTSCGSMDFVKEHPVAALSNAFLKSCEKYDEAIVANEHSKSPIVELEKLLNEYRSVKNCAISYIKADAVERFVVNNADSMLLTNKKGKSGLELLVEAGCTRAVGCLFEVITEKTYNAQQILKDNSQCAKDITRDIYLNMVDYSEEFGLGELDFEKYCANRQQILKLVPYADLSIRLAGQPTLLYRAVQVKDYAFIILLLANDPRLLNVRDEYSQQLPTEMAKGTEIYTLLKMIESSIDESGIEEPTEELALEGLITEEELLQKHVEVGKSRFQELVVGSIGLVASTVLVCMVISICAF